MDPADARNILGNEIKKWSGGSAGLEGCSGETILQDLQDTERPTENPQTMSVHSEDFDLPGQAKTLPDERTLWKVNILSIGLLPILFV